MIVFFMSMSSLPINLGILGFKGIVPEVVASLVISLKWASYGFYCCWTPLEIFCIVQPNV
jgi:hypothetical protein